MFPLTNLAVVILVGLLVALSEAQLTQDDRQKFLDKHNEYRRGVSPAAANMKKMKWNQDLEAMAQIWAERCKFEHGHPPYEKKPYNYIGQNLWSGSGKLDPNGTVTSWHNEVNHYTYSTHTCSRDCGHYTQVVWAKSFQVGCGAKKCGKSVIVVCNYGPAGNLRGTRPYKSGDTCSECPDGHTCDDKMCVDKSIDYNIPARASSRGPGSEIIIMAVTVMMLVWRRVL